jgi:hypothetical protein
MMDVQLNSWLLFAHAGTHHRHAEIVSRLPDGSVVRHTYGEWARRTQQLMHALDALGLDRGARIATLAWNSFRHLEAYFAVPCTGRVLHTGNIRLSSEELQYLLEHAEDEALLIDADLLPLIEPIRDSLPKLRHVIVLGDRVPDTSITGVLAYEALLAEQPDHYAPIEIEERTPLGRGPPGAPRLRCTPIAPRSCTPRRWPGRPACASAARTAPCRSCRCSTPTPGACPMRRSATAPSSCCTGVPCRPPTSWIC